MKKFYPLLLAPIFKDYIWGGDRLKREYNKKTDIAPLAESWELACHPDGTNKILNGPYANFQLDQFIAENPEAAGTKASGAEVFPLLIKLIDAKKDLSVQLHPIQKTEMWYILDCDPGADIIFGLKENVSIEKLEQDINNSQVLEDINIVPVHRGDAFLIKARTIHAIRKGILIAEIQQNCNITYRVYDYDRKGKDGKPRPLHIAEALKTIDMTATGSQAVQPVQITYTADTVMTTILSCEFFTVKKLELSGHALFPDCSITFTHMLCINGYAKLEWPEGSLDIKKGDSVFIPASCGQYTLEGNACLLISQL